MGFFSGLGKIAGGVGALVGAPLTGGATLAALPGILGGIGDLAAGGSQNRAQGRILESGILQDQDRNQLIADQNFENNLINRGNLDLSQRTFQENAPNTRLGRTGDLDRIRNFDRRAAALNATRGFTNEDFTIGDRTVSVPRRNALDFSAFAPSGETRSLADLIAARDVEAQMAGDRFDPLPALEKTQLSQLPQAGKFDTFLNTVAGVGGTVGAIGDALERLPKRTGQSNIPPSAILKDVQFGTPPIMPPQGTLFGGSSPFSFSDRVQQRINS